MGGFNSDVPKPKQLKPEEILALNEGTSKYKPMNLDIGDVVGKATKNINQLRIKKEM